MGVAETLPPEESAFPLRDWFTRQMARTAKVVQIEGGDTSAGGLHRHVVGMLYCLGRAPLEPEHHQRSKSSSRVEVLVREMLR